MFKSISRKLITSLNYIESYGDHSETSLSVVQFMVIAVIEQLHCEFFVQFFDDVLAKNTGEIFITYMFQMLFLKIPYHFFLIFLGSYTKRKVIRLFQCIPFFKGMGFVLLLARNITLIFNQYVASCHICIYYFFQKNNVFEKHWINCEFAEATNSCISMVNNTSVNCKPGYHEVSQFQYIRTHILMQKDSLEFGLNMRLVFINWCIWLAGSVFLFLGLNRIINVFLMVMIGSATLSVLVVAGLLGSIPDLQISALTYMTKANSELFPRFGNELIFWTISIIHSMAPLQLASSVWLGALKPPEVKLTICTIGIYVTASLLMILNIFFVKYSLDTFVYKYRSVFKTCSLLIPADDIIAVILEHLLLTDQPQLWMSSFLLGYTLYICMQNFISELVIFESIIDAFPQLGQNRFITSLAFCTINHMLSLLWASSVARKIWHVWSREEAILLGTITIALVSICFNYIYTLDMILADYGFFYNEEPCDLFKHLWAILPILSLLMLCVQFQWIATTNTFSMGTDLSLTCCVLTVVLLSPLLFFFVVELSKGINDENEHPDRPGRDWGPADPEERVKRNKFYPFRNLRYRHTSMTSCHDRLSKVKKYSIEVDSQNEKYEDALQLIVWRKPHNMWKSELVINVDK